MFNGISPKRSLRPHLALFILVTALTGCGGGSGPATVPGSDIPVSATTDTAQLLAFGNGVLAGSSDSSEPLETGDVNLAISETDEPDSSV